MSTYVRPLRPETCRRCTLPKDLLGVLNGRDIAQPNWNATAIVAIWSCKRCDRNGYR